MRKRESKLRMLIAWFHARRDAGEVDPRQANAAVRALRRIVHAQKTGNRRLLDEALNDLARAFLRE